MHMLFLQNFPLILTPVLPIILSAITIPIAYSLQSNRKEHYFLLYTLLYFPIPLLKGTNLYIRVHPQETTYCCLSQNTLVLAYSPLLFLFFSYRLPKNLLISEIISYSLSTTYWYSLETFGLRWQHTLLSNTRFFMSLLNPLRRLLPLFIPIFKRRLRHFNYCYSSRMVLILSNAAPILSLYPFHYRGLGQYLIFSSLSLLIWN